MMAKEKIINILAHAFPSWIDLQGIRSGELVIPSYIKTTVRFTRPSAVFRQTDG